MAPEKHTRNWCENNPSQASADLERMNLAIREALRLLRTGVEADRKEALIWLHNASQI